MLYGCARNNYNCLGRKWPPLKGLKHRKPPSRTGLHVIAYVTVKGGDKKSYFLVSAG